MRIPVATGFLVSEQLFQPTSPGKCSFLQLKKDKCSTHAASTTQTFAMPVSIHTHILAVNVILTAISTASVFHTALCKPSKQLQAIKKKRTWLKTTAFTVYIQTSSIPGIELTDSFFNELCNFLSSVVAVLWMTFFFLLAEPWKQKRKRKLELRINAQYSSLYPYKRLVHSP